MQDGFIRQFNDKCAACHGEDLRGTTLGKPLAGVDNKVTPTETLLKDLARCRDIEVGPRGEIYLLLENRRVPNRAVGPIFMRRRQ